MSYEAKKVSNFVLSEADRFQRGITNLRLNKLLYLAHGWSLTRTEGGLIRNHFEAWKLGPVVKTVFEQARAFGDRPISRPFVHLNYATGRSEPVGFDDIDSEHRDLIIRIVSYYDDWSTHQLVDLTHELGGPWDAVIRHDASASNRIPHELIKAHFRAKLGDSARN